MKIYLSENDVLEILALRFGLEVEDASTEREKKSVLAWDEIYWGGATVKLPKVRNRVDYRYIDGTPKGYALRILEHYRERCNEKWEVSGILENEARIYKMMNEAQVERAKELDRAIEILKKGG